MAIWSDFYPDLMPSVIGCPNPLADLALLRASQEFFRRTRAWSEWLEPLTTVDGVREYDLDLPTGSQVVRLEKCTMGGSVVDVLSHNEQASNYATSEQDEFGIVSRDRSVFFLTQQVAAGSIISVMVSLMPGKLATGIPDDLLDQHGPDIVSGAKHRLMMVPETTFSNPDLAMVAKAEFEAAIGSKAASSWRGFSGVTPRPKVRFV